MNESNPYETPKTALVDAVVATDHLADRGARLLAAIIDGVLLMAIVMPMMWFGGYWEVAMQSAARGEQVPFLTTLMWSAVGFAIFGAVQGTFLAQTAQTIGKKVMKIRVAHLDGTKPSLGVLLGKRYLPVQLTNLIPFVGSLIGIVNVLLIFRADRRCGHDLIAGTQVVKAD